MNTNARKQKGEQAARPGQLMPLTVVGKGAGPYPSPSLGMPGASPMTNSCLSFRSQPKCLSWPPRARESSRVSLIPLLGTMTLDGCLPHQSVGPQGADPDPAHPWLRSPCSYRPGTELVLSISHDPAIEPETRLGILSARGFNIGNWLSKGWKIRKPKGMVKKTCDSRTRW